MRLLGSMIVLIVLFFPMLATAIAPNYYSLNNIINFGEDNNAMISSEKNDQDIWKNKIDSDLDNLITSNQAQSSDKKFMLNIKSLDWEKNIGFSLDQVIRESSGKDLVSMDIVEIGANENKRTTEILSFDPIISYEPEMGSDWNPIIDIPIFSFPESVDARPGFSM
jgi:hypothetical protein